MAAICSHCKKVDAKREGLLPAGEAVRQTPTFHAIWLA